MKLTNRQLLNAVPAFNHINGLKMPVKASFTVARTARTIDENLKDYNKTLEVLQKKHAEKDEDGECKVVDDKYVFEDADAFVAEYNELLDCKVDMSVKKISLNEFGSAEVEPAFLYHLDWFIED